MSKIGPLPSDRFEEDKRRHLLFPNYRRLDPQSAIQAAPAVPPNWSLIHVVPLKLSATSHCDLIEVFESGQDEISTVLTGFIRGPTA